MFERYGPWSSALDDGPSARLGTFWRSRLAMLEAARTSRPGLSRRDWLRLGAAGAAACAVPTVRFAPADAPGPGESRPAGGGRIYATVFFFEPAPGGPVVNAGAFAIDPATGAFEKRSDCDGWVRISRDGRTLALVRFHARPGGPSAVGVSTLDASGRGEGRRVTDFGGITCWSPDGRRLIVTRWRWASEPGGESLSENLRFDADGSGATRLPIPETDAVYDWSPDGRWLATVSGRHAPEGVHTQVYRMRPDGTEQLRLTEGGGLNVFPRFSPDGRRVAYHRQDRDGDSIWVVDIDGGGRRRVLAEEPDGVAPDHVCWSPDGRSLACPLFRWERDERGRKVLGGNEDGPRRIAIVDVEGTDRRVLELPNARWIQTLDWG